MNLSKRRLLISTFIHGVAFIFLIINLFFLNFNIILEKPFYIFINIALALIAMLLFGIVLLIRKGTDSTPLFGILINVYIIIIVMGTLFFYNP